MFCNNCGKQLDQNDKFCQKCGKVIGVLDRKNTSLKWFKKHKKPLLIIGGVFLLLIIVLIALAANTNPNNSTDITNSNAPAQTVQANYSFPATTTVDQDEIVSSVVNIWCPDNTTASATGGSGTLWTSDGLILTNSHIIPQDKNEQPLVNSCMVMLSNAQGSIKDIYEGEPIIIPILSKEYDLAFIKINAAYTDSYGVDHGPYPTTFPAYPDFGCKDDAVTLSEPVTVLGYPEISGNGNSLTITTGVVSSLPGDGTIVTSAKVAHGDSGGLAVDEYGCMIGVPSMISADQVESLGIIKSNSVVENFLSDVKSALDQSNQSTTNNQY